MPEIPLAGELPLTASAPDPQASLVQSLRHQCPSCQAIGLAPHPSLSHGDSVIWACDQCESVFDIRTMFNLIPPERLNLVRKIFNPDRPVEVDIDGDPPPSEPSAELQRLVEMLGEIMFLRDRLLGLEDEAQRLRETLDYPPE